MLPLELHKSRKGSTTPTLRVKYRGIVLTTHGEWLGHDLSEGYLGNGECLPVPPKKNRDQIYGG